MTGRGVGRGTPPRGQPPTGPPVRPPPPPPGTAPPARLPPPGAAPTARMPPPGAAPTARMPPPGAAPPARLPPPGAAPTARLPTPGAGPPARLPPPGAAPTARLPTPGAGLPARLLPPGAAPTARMPPPGAAPSARLPTPGAVPSARLPTPGAAPPSLPTAGPSAGLPPPPGPPALTPLQEHIRAKRLEDAAAVLLQDPNRPRGRGMRMPVVAAPESQASTFGPGRMRQFDDESVVTDVPSQGSSGTDRTQPDIQSLNLSEQSEKPSQNLDMEPTLSSSTGSDDSGPKEYRGKSGKPLRVYANYLELAISEGKGIFEYEVSYEPRVDSRNQRFKLLNQHRDIIGPEKSFDGVKLFLPWKLPDVSTTAEGKHSETGEMHKITLNFKRAATGGDREVVQFFNILFNRIFRLLEFSQHKNRNFYDHKSRYEIKQHNLQVWPGYVTAVDFYEGGLLLQIDVSHRVLRTESVRDLLVAITRKGGDIKSEAEKQLLGTSIITRYNNKSYRIDDLDFELSPRSTFTNSNGEELSYMDYYKRQYGIDILDKEQPIIINRPKKNEATDQGVDKIICLIPELCLPTGLTDAMRADFKIMKEVSNFTRVSPASRKTSMAKFVERVKGCQAAVDMLAAWGLLLGDEPYGLNARQLAPEKIVFGGGYSEIANPKGDWGRSATSKKALTGVSINKWAILFPEKNHLVVKQFALLLQQNGARMGINIAIPKIVPLRNDRNDTYLSAMKELIDPTTQLLMTVVPAIKSDRYAAIKKLCYVEKPVASQVIVLKTISNDKRLASVAQKVVLQMNCKLGGELWACQTPFKQIMVIGIDVFHDKSRKSGSIAGMVSSLNDNMSRYFSNVAIQKQGQELVDALKICFAEALIKYYDVNHYFPANIVVFRDGVGDGQMEATAKHEIPQFRSIFKQVKGVAAGPGGRLATLLPKGYDPGFNFCVVQKRINTRIFSSVPVATGGHTFDNPPPGTIVDHTITRFQFKDFFLVPMSVTQGTVTPTHFVVLDESGKGFLEADEMQKLAYKLTHMYFNWPGTVRVPSPCQYAHKLVDMVGENLHQVPSPVLGDKLYYL